MCAARTVAWKAREGVVALGDKKGYYFYPVKKGVRVFLHPYERAYYLDTHYWLKEATKVRHGARSKVDARDDPDSAPSGWSHGDAAGRLLYRLIAMNMKFPCKQGIMADGFHYRVVSLFSICVRATPGKNWCSRRQSVCEATEEAAKEDRLPLRTEEYHVWPLTTLQSEELAYWAGPRTKIELPPAWKQKADCVDGMASAIASFRSQVDRPSYIQWPLRVFHFTSETEEPDLDAIQLPFTRDDGEAQPEWLSSHGLPVVYVPGHCIPMEEQLEQMWRPRPTMIERTRKPARVHFREQRRAIASWALYSC
jgi:hypothetical protein